MDFILIALRETSLKFKKNKACRYGISSSALETIGSKRCSKGFIGTQRERIRGIVRDFELILWERSPPGACASALRFKRASAAEHH